MRYTICGYIGESSNWSGYQTLTLSVGVQITSPLPVSPSASTEITIGLGYYLDRIKLVDHTLVSFEPKVLMRSMFASRSRRIVSTNQDPIKTRNLQS